MILGHERPLRAHEQLCHLFASIRSEAVRTKRCPYTSTPFTMLHKWLFHSAPSLSSPAPACNERPRSHLSQLVSRKFPECLLRRHWPWMTSSANRAEQGVSPICSFRVGHLVAGSYPAFITCSLLSPAKRNYSRRP